MASPVFKAMLSSDFKEIDAPEIPFPGKKVNEFVDLLRLIYPLLKSEITIKNVEYIYRLADEYQMTREMKDCRMFLASVKKTKENAMDMLLLSQAIGSDDARQQCFDVLQRMTLTELEEQEGFTNLDASSIRTLLLPIAKRLHSCVKQTLPELVGALDGMMNLWIKKENVYKMRGAPNMCSKHSINAISLGRYESRIANNKRMCDRVKCDFCRAMFKQMAANAGGYQSPCNMYLSENIVSVLEEMMDLLKD